ncbi:alpha/beta hydrolase family protein [Hymenobacter ruricola]|uniref:DUF2974 domain-containing protein n=1 Tax=Hymenobacter ruricola TaxID=2791023 RepID=A0ABS0HYC0_9BACT|nr:hypothetical protein [Hymenobacter ruricola]MBF9219680.1 hypothetical protein [Hymenobacter ruricola]
MQNWFALRNTGAQLLLPLLLLTACQRPADVVVNLNGQQCTRTPAQLAQGQLTPGLQDADYPLVSDLAMLSAIVYSGVKSANHRPDYSQDTTKYAVERRELARRGWRPFAFRYPLVAAPGQRLAGGLVYDVWVRPGPVPLAVLVFRGTNYLEFADWVANTRPLTNNPWFWDQYEQARALTPAVVARLDSAYGGRARIFAAGHSLGGGLAQHAGYTSPRIEKVFAFNSSPLTGYFDVAKKDRLPPGSARRTFLVYESYEVLTLFRFVPVQLNRFAKNVDLVVVRYNFTTGLDSPSPFRQHEMQRLVAGLRAAR